MKTKFGSNEFSQVENQLDYIFHDLFKLKAHQILLSKNTFKSALYQDNLKSFPNDMETINEIIIVRKHIPLKINTIVFE